MTSEIETIAAAALAGSKSAELIANRLTTQATPDLWRELTEIVSTSLNDTLATMRHGGLSDELLSTYREAYGLAYESCLDAAFGKPSALTYARAL